MFERVIAGLTKTIKNSFELEKDNNSHGFLQGLDPRFVFLSLMFLLVVTVLLRNLASILFMIALSISLAALSKVNIPGYLRRVWTFVPLFTLVIMLPAMTNLVTPGTPLFGEGGIFGTNIYFTQEGVYNAIVFTLRVGAAVSWSVLLISIVEWSRLMKAMYDLKFPRTFIMILDMTYRYIQLLLDVTLTMFMARKSRMSGKATSKEVRVIGGSTVTSIFSRSYHMSEQVFQAMISRGYQGNPRMLTEFKAEKWDYALLIILVSFALILVIFDDFQAQGVSSNIISVIEAAL